MNTLAAVRSVLEAQRDAIASRFGVQLYGIVGSFARGDHDADSDVDVAARVCGRPTLFDLAELAEELSEAVGRPVDVVFPDDMPDYKRTLMLKSFVPL